MTNIVQHGRGKRGVPNAVLTRGYTLGELLNVTAIVGALTAVTLPPLQSLHMQARVKSASREFAVDLRRARVEAITTRSAVRLIPHSDRDWSSGWQVVSASGVVSERVGPLGIETSAAIHPISYSSFGKPVQTGGYSVLFHAPTYRWVDPYCVHVGPDGRPSVEKPSQANGCAR